MSTHRPRPRPFMQLDVFTRRPGMGNPLAVVLDAEGLSEQDMQAIARWTRLPETTFVLPPSDAHSSYRLRMFSPRREVPFAGHPSVGTAYAVLLAGLATPRDGLLVQHGIAGKLPLKVQGEGETLSIAIRAPRAHLLETTTANDSRFGRALADLPLGSLPPALMDGGRRWWLVEVADEASLRAAAPNWDAIAALAQTTESMGICAYARSSNTDYALAVRAWVGSGTPFEDAASGAANATLAAWLNLRAALPDGQRDYRVSQGREIGYDALLALSVDEAGDVWSGGQVCRVIDGQIFW
ncbi:phenazine biosynthesis protein PhzF family [Lysobacteraceae bacterium NML120232]|nr:phenazine biosynthesis protein PhzF family [Xanthomonadaceae bacterium NML120232]